jgi:hypothetical protein
MKVVQLPVLPSFQWHIESTSSDLAVSSRGKEKSVQVLHRSSMTE